MSPKDTFSGICVVMGSAWLRLGIVTVKSPLESKTPPFYLYIMILETRMLRKTCQSPSTYVISSPFKLESHLMKYMSRQNRGEGY